MCAERRERLWEKWRERGAKVGVREWDVKCAVESEDVVVSAGTTSKAAENSTTAKVGMGEKQHVSTGTKEDADAATHVTGAL